MFDPSIVLGLGLPFCGMGIITLPPLTLLLSGYEGNGNEVGYQSSHTQATGSLYSPYSSRGEPIEPVCQRDSYELTLSLCCSCPISLCTSSSALLSFFLYALPTLYTLALPYTLKSQLWKRPYFPRPR